MSKNGKCINIFEENKKNLNLYQISIIFILLITFLQVGINSIKYTQLNDYIDTHEWQQNLQSNKVNNISSVQNAHTKEFNTNLSKLKDVSSIIGMEKIQSIYSDSDKVQIQGYCEDTKVLEQISDLKSIKDFNIKGLQKKDKEYFFHIEYKIGG